MKRVAFAVIIAAGLTSAAIAKPPPKGAYKFSEEEAQAAMRDYVACSVKASPALASQAVVEDWETRQLIGQGSKLVSPACTRAAGLVGQMRFQPEIFRAAAAERLIVVNSTIAPTKEVLAPLAPLAYHMPWPVKTVDDKGKPLSAEAIAKQQEGYNHRLAVIAGQQIGECTVKADPQTVRKLFDTADNSDAELAAMKALTGILPGCVPAQKKFSFNRQSLRGSLAMAYYRLAMASKGVVWAGEPSLLSKPSS